VVHIAAAASIHILAAIAVLSNSLGTFAMPRVVSLKGEEFDLEAEAPASVPGSSGTSSRRRRRTLGAHSLDVNTTWAAPAAFKADVKLVTIPNDVQASVASGDSNRTDGIVNLGAVYHASGTNASKPHRAPRSKVFAPSALVANSFVDEPWEEGDESYLPSGRLLELHLHDITLKELRHSTKSSVTEFLLALHSELGRNMQRVSILGLHERYRQNLPDEAMAEEPPKRLSQEVVVRFEAAPKRAASQASRVLETLSAQLDDPTCSLRKGPFAFAFANTTLSEEFTPDLGALGSEVHGETATIGAMALPIGISATFTGILLWLAAW